MINFLKKHRERQQQARHQEWLKQEQEWQEFQLNMDYMASKISYDEMVEARKRIRQGEEYIGWALRKRP